MITENPEIEQDPNFVSDDGLSIDIDGEDMHLIVTNLKRWGQETPDFGADYKAEMDYYKTLAASLREVLPSTHLQRAFDAVHAATMHDRGDLKRIEAYLHNLARTELEQPLKHYPLVYCGSGTDVDYPLLMGGRHVIMLDPTFGEKYNSFSEVLNRVALIVDPATPTVKDKTISFQFDFGSGLEDVCVECVPAVLGDFADDAQFKEYCQNVFGSTDFVQYTPPDKIAVLMEYASGQAVGSRQRESLHEHVVTGGRFNASPQDLEFFVRRLADDQRKDIASKMQTGEIDAPEKLLEYVQQFLSTKLIPVALEKKIFCFSVKN